MINIENYKIIHNILTEFCIPKHLLGYEYIITGIYILINNPEMQIVDLYNEIAKIHNSKASNCERSIRHAIECGYDNCKDCNFDSFKRICYTNRKPSNSEFLKSIAIELKLQ